MWHLWGTGVVHKVFWYGELREGDHLEDRGIDWRILLKWFFNKWDGGGHGLDCSGSG
jgi:hypothetical protein